jgi:uncharacterized membrane protein
MTKTNPVVGVPGNERINALNDGVFAIVITLLVLELKVPEIPPNLVATELPHALQEAVPKVLSHIISFVVLGIYWVGQHNMFLHIKRHNRILLWLDIFFLLCVASMPFPTGLIVQYGQEQIAVVIYAGTLIITGLALDLIWWYASHNHRLVDKNIDPKLVTFVHQRTLLAPVIYLVAIGLSFISLFVAKLCFVAVALLYILPNPLDHYHHSGLHEQVKVWD